ncbi:related to PENTAFUNCTIONAL AROM POLYPEPTIDE [Phialocephala subalpina]|uniref:Related to PENTAFUNCTIONAL AROM POLYPEPTIDE n=1 Tax=Phialocephala subalpina TaxID=576137 RepID=A0A1L7X6N3_9HELO|nr:related to PENTAFUNCTIONAL AROM POLYPEPTIDE [Phialocephala subalpina]
MATKQLQTAQSAPTPTRPKSTNGVINGTKAGTGDTRIVVIIYGQGQEKIVSVFADVLGKPYRLAASFSQVGSEDHGTVIGIHTSDAKADIGARNRMLMVAINAHCVNLGMPPDVDLSTASDYEFLYTEQPFFRRDLSRFIAFTLGQISHHEALITKPRTYFISTTFPDVRTALSNLDILSVGSDAVEIRVDLLKEPLPDGTYSSVPSLSYVGEQVMLLRQRTELPIIFTTRCTRENGRFPMDNPDLYYEYLYRAIQWGCEYVDVEVWLPEDIRRRLYELRGNSRIISAFHDFSGTFKWPSPQAQAIFQESRKYGDIVKMITIINSMSENYELEYFRSQIKANNPDGPPLSAVNMGQLGQLSRALNTVFSPITHPLLPIVAAPGQMSAAEINGALSTMGQLPKKNIYAIGSFRSTPQATFFENDAARTIGAVDTIVVRDNTFIGDNATWKGIRATLTRDFAPSAYKDRAAIILSSNGEDAASVIFALRSLNIGKIYTVGFKAHGPLAAGVEPFTSIESVQRVDQPFAIISALSPEKSHLVQPLLRHFSNTNRSNSNLAGTAAASMNGGNGGKGKVFVDLANGSRKGDPLAVAEASGWTAYGVADTSAFTTVETLRLLVGQNVPYSFVRLASGRGLY